MNQISPHANSYVKCENMYTSRENPYYNEDPRHDIYVIMENGKHGLIHATDFGTYDIHEEKKVLLPVEYDDIFCIHQRVNPDTQHFKICRDNKVGLFEVTHKNREITSKFVIDCEFDYMYAHENVYIYVFVNSNGCRYFNSSTCKVSEYIHCICSSGPYSEFCDYLWVHDGDKYCLIDLHTDKIVFESTHIMKPMSIGASSYIDFKTGQIATKCKDSWRISAQYTIIAPITIFPYPCYTLENIASIIKKTPCISENAGIGAIDHQGEILIEPEYDEVKYELKITATKGGNEVEVFVPIGKCDKDSTLSNRAEKGLMP